MLLFSLPIVGALVTRRAALLSAPAWRAASTASLAEHVAMATTHRVAEVEVRGAHIPVALWYPAAASPPLRGEARAEYSYVIDIGGIARNFKVGWLLGWLPRREFTLPRASATFSRDGSAALRSDDCIMFTHGFLGSPLDQAHACEALADLGFTVAAPEFPESLSASYPKPDGLTRAEIAAATRELVGGGRWGVFGHSAGAGTALTLPERYVLGRCALCPGFRGYDNADPLLIIASEGDAVHQLLVSNGVDLEANLQADAAQGRGETRMYARAEQIYAERAPPRRAALLFKDGGELAERLPNHLSFLWVGVDEAMVGGGHFVGVDRGEADVWLGSASWTHGTHVRSSCSRPSSRSPRR